MYIIKREAIMNAGVVIGRMGPRKQVVMGHYMHYEACTTHTIFLTHRGIFTYKDITPARRQSRALRPTHNGCLVLDRCIGDVERRLPVLHSSSFLTICASLFMTQIHQSYS